MMIFHPSLCSKLVNGYLGNTSWKNGHTNNNLVRAVWPERYVMTGRRTQSAAANPYPLPCLTPQEDEDDQLSMVIRPVSQ